MGDAATDRRRRFEAEAVAFMQPLYRTALHLTRNPDDAGDLVQETYLRAYRAFDQFTVLLWFAHAPARLPAAVAQDFAEFQAGRLLLEARTTEPRDLERWFASRGTGFETHVYDLAMMDYKLAGGSVHRTQSRPSTLFAYEGPGGAQLLCEMYKGRLDKLPAATETLEHDGISFRVYHRKNGLTAVFWQEGEVICVLVSDIAAHDVIQFAFAKASRAPP